MNTQFFEIKRQLVITVLKKLQKTRDLAEGFLLVVESQDLTEDILNALVSALAEAIEAVSLEGEQEKLHDALILVDQIQKNEKLSREKEQLELEEILKEIDGF